MLYPTTVDLLGAQVKPTVCCLVATPAPVAVNVDECVVALLLSVKVANVEPLLLGLKLTLTEILCPAAMVFGKVMLLSVNSGFVVDAAEIVTAADPALNVVVLVEVVPTVTLPKLKLVGETVRVPAVLLLELPDKATVTLVAFDAETENVPV